jgi:hypothetical protein
VTLLKTSKAVSSGRIGTACCARMPPASGFSTMPCSVAPVSRSPWMMAQFTGTRPRYFGSSEPCMFHAPRVGKASSGALSIRR